MFLDKLTIQQEIPLVRTFHGHMCNHEHAYRYNTKTTRHQQSLGLRQIQRKLFGSILPLESKSGMELVLCLNNNFLLTTARNASVLYSIQTPINKWNNFCFQHFSSLADGLDLTSNYVPLLSCLQTDLSLLAMLPSMSVDISVLIAEAKISQRKVSPVQFLMSLSVGWISFPHLYWFPQGKLSGGWRAKSQFPTRNPQ
jgi:hypothetical protein